MRPTFDRLTPTPGLMRQSRVTAALIRELSLARTRTGRRVRMRLRLTGIHSRHPCGRRLWRGPWRGLSRYTGLLTRTDN